jgi:hypothetical protein
MKAKELLMEKNGMTRSRLTDICRKRAWRPPQK